MALLGHSGSQAPQLMHSSVILIDIDPFLGYSTQSYNFAERNTGFNMNLDQRIALLSWLGDYMLAHETTWQQAQEQACHVNSWFIPEHVIQAVENIATCFLQADLLEKWAQSYTMPSQPCHVGIVMAGNIPLVGFHDFLSAFITGHYQHIKLSSKDNVLLLHLIQKLIQKEPSLSSYLHVETQLKNCDAYIATGSNNTSRYFEAYFAKYPHIIRKNRTSIAVLDGTESREDLEQLGEDIFAYFGLGCRNVTQIYVPEGYNFEPLLKALQKYEYYMQYHKYKNNFDYHLSIFLLNNVPVLTNNSILLVENELPFAAVSVLHYQYYTDLTALTHTLQNDERIQAIVGKNHIPLGNAQKPSLSDYADGVDTMQFLCGL